MTDPRTESRRRFDYERRLLPNPYVGELDPEDGDVAVEKTGLTIGYPAWNLLYYTLLCSIPPEVEEPVVIETGTNLGLSTIMMAQAMKDLGVAGKVETVDIRPRVIETAQRRVRRAGLSEYVEFHVEDSLAFLRRLCERVDHINFVFLDDRHEQSHVLEEISIVYPRVAACDGKIYFDNTLGHGVGGALEVLVERYGGNLVRFDNCSWAPPGNAIWQPDRTPRTGAG